MYSLLNERASVMACHGNWLASVRRSHPVVRSVISAHFAAASKTSGIKKLCCLLKIGITSVTDANENEDTSRRCAVVVCCFGDEICDDMPLLN